MQFSIPSILDMLFVLVPVAFVVFSIAKRSRDWIRFQKILENGAVIDATVVFCDNARHRWPPQYSVSIEYILNTKKHSAIIEGHSRDKLDTGSLVPVLVWEEYPYIAIDPDNPPSKWQLVCYIALALAVLFFWLRAMKIIPFI